MSTKSGSIGFFLTLWMTLNWTSLHSATNIFPTRLDDAPSCNLYLSSRFCRPCLYTIKTKLKDFSHVDTLFIVTEANNTFERDHFMDLLEKELSKVEIKDTIFESYHGDYFSPESHTNFKDSCLNSLFSRSTPFIFSRSSCTEFEFFGT